MILWASNRVVVGGVESKPAGHQLVKDRAPALQDVGTQNRCRSRHGPCSTLMYCGVPINDRRFCVNRDADAPSSVGWFLLIPKSRSLMTVFPSGAKVKKNFGGLEVAMDDYAGGRGRLQHVADLPLCELGRERAGSASGDLALPYKQRAQRYQTAKELRKALERAFARLPVGAGGLRWKGSIGLASRV